MKEEVLQIRIHGRGGQGAKTASQFIAEAGMDQGKYVKAFPEYGPERRGAPMVAYSRISNKPITTYAPIKHPNIVLVIDHTLVDLVDVIEGLNDKGYLIVNSEDSINKIKEKTKFKGKIHVVNASNIAIETVGRDLPNIPMLGALVKVTNAVSLKSLKNKIHEKFDEKIGKDKTKKTIETLERGYKEVQ